MGRIEKTVFISYRRTNKPWALFIYQSLTNHGYDVFIDFQNINSGNFEAAILDNIKARAHFVVVLTPSALEDCKKPGDWLRREIEAAMDEKRNIVPLMVEGFDFGSPLIKNALTGKLAALSQINGLRIPDDYPFEAMDRLRERYLSVALNDVNLPMLQPEAKEIAIAEKSAANEAPLVKEEQLTAQTWFERGYVFHKDNNYGEAIRCLTNAIKLQSDFANAYYLRGTIKYLQNDHDGALLDLNKAILIEPNHPAAHASRATTREKINDWDGAIADYTEFLQSEQFGTEIIAKTYYRRGAALFKQDKIDQAIKDFTKAIELSPNSASYYFIRGVVRNFINDPKTAIADFDEAIRLEPANFEAYFNRGLARGTNEDTYGAIADFDKTISLKPDYIDAYKLRASLHEATKDWKNAIADYQNYLELGGSAKDEQKEVEKTIKEIKRKLTKKKPLKKNAK